MLRIGKGVWCSRLSIAIVIVRASDTLAVDLRIWPGTTSKLPIACAKCIFTHPSPVLNPSIGALDVSWPHYTNYRYPNPLYTIYEIDCSLFFVNVIYVNILRGVSVQYTA